MFTTIATRGIMKWNLKEWLTGICFHSGRTREVDYGHSDFNNVSLLGPYHFHHGLPPHLHPHTILTPEIAMYEYIYRKLTEKNYNISPKPNNYPENEKSYTVSRIQKSFINNGELLLGHKIINPEDVYNALTYAENKNIARHCTNDDFDSADDAALAFIFRYSSDAQSRGSNYYTAICTRRYITSPDTSVPAPTYYFCQYETTPFNLDTAKRRFPKLDVAALVFTNSIPTAWSLDYRREIVDSFGSISILPVYYMRGKNFYRWSSLLIDRTNDLFCSLEGFEPKEVVEELRNTYVTKEQLIAIGWNPVTDEVFLNMNKMMDKYDINTTERIRHFLAQALHETMDGRYVREGEYHLYPPDNWTQQQYEDFFNTKYAYKYKYRGGGYIQTTWDYEYQSFATYMISQEYPEYNIATSNPANEGLEIIVPRYNKALEVANQNGLDIKKYIDIYEKGTDYTVEHFKWEMTGWEWQCKGLNTIIDNAESGYSNYTYTDSTEKEVKILNSVVSVTAKINGTDALMERQKKYDIVVGVIK